MASLCSDEKPFNSNLILENLSDMEWNIAVTAASSNDDGVGKTKLNFKYAMECGGEKQNVIMQLSPQEFYKLLHEMDRVKGNLQSLTGGSNVSS